ncbi:MAG: serine/threonine protein kinase [Candidatus Bathyarchaeia archaeon]|jgi:putative serine/threonine protein kinase
MSKSTIVPIAELQNMPYASVVCYPRAKHIEVQGRIEELRQLGVESVEFTGTGSAFTLQVLGKGFVGIVVVAYVDRKRFALKMRRVDGGREDFLHEAEMLQKANAVGVGPKFVAVTRNFLLSQLIDGDLLANWLGAHKEKTEFRRVLGDILEQCWRLDEAGLDHGELSKAPRHLLMTQKGEPFIVDFETASTQRHASNVTAVCQYLFAGNSIVPKLVWEVLGEKDRYQIIDALKDYKKNRSRNSFEALLKVCL